MDSENDRKDRFSQDMEAPLWHSYLLNALMDNVPDLIYFKDAESRFVKINLAMARKFGLNDPEEAVGKSDNHFFSKEHAEQAYQDEQSIILTGNPIVAKEEMETWPNCPPTWVSSTKMPLKDDEGNIIGTFGISREITENKKIRQAIVRKLDSLTKPSVDDNQVRFEDLFDLKEFQRIQDEFSAATGVASITTHPDGSPITNPSNFTRFCNGLVRATEKGCLNCYKSDAVLGAPNPKGPTVQHCLSGGLWDAGASIIVGGRHVANWLIGQVRDQSQNDDAIRQYARDIGIEEDCLVEAFHEVPSMSYQQFTNVAKSLYTLAGQMAKTAYYNLLQARFIAEQSKATEELQEREANLEQLNATKDKFFSIIAHDLRTPFNSIISFSDLMMEKLDENRIDKVRDYTGIIQSASRQALNLLSNLLDWARSQTGSIVYSPRVIDLKELVRQIICMSGCMTGSKSIVLKEEIPENTLAVADVDIVSTVLRNLVCNAVKFSHPGGKITIGLENNPSKWILWVKDNGVGIDESHIGKLFLIEESFSTKGTANEQGTGLGLILCKELVEKQGGVIWVESQPGVGTTVFFTIPIND